MDRGRAARGSEGLGRVRSATRGAPPSEKAWAASQREDPSEMVIVFDDWRHDGLGSISARRPQWLVMVGDHGRRDDGMVGGGTVEEKKEYYPTAPLQDLVLVGGKARSNETELLSYGPGARRAFGESAQPRANPPPEKASATFRQRDPQRMVIVLDDGSRGDWWLQDDWWLQWRRRDAVQQACRRAWRCSCCLWIADWDWSTRCSRTADTPFRMRQGYLTVSTAEVMKNSSTPSQWPAVAPASTQDS